MSRFTIAIIGLLLLSSCAGSTNSDPIQQTFGPTVLGRAGAAYTLYNRRLMLTIDPNTGAATLHANGRSAGKPVIPIFVGQPDSAPAEGYIESRDEETWQYIGQSKDGHVGWRIVYSLYYDAANVTYIVQNKSAAEVTGHMEFATPSDISIQPFNEDAALNTPNPAGVIRGDDRTLAPNERINFAMRWTLPDANR